MRRAGAHPRLARRAAGAAGTLGASTTASRLRAAVEREAPVVVEVPRHLLPATPVFRMLPHGGRDLVASALSRGWNDFERPMPDAFTALVHHVGGSVLDIGANTGVYSLLATCADPSCSVIAFEPFPPVLALLRRNLALNGVERRVEVVEVALGDRAGQAELFVPDPGHGLVETSCSLNESFKDDKAGSVTVPVTTVDAFLAERGPAAAPTVLKIDVESLEHAVLAGAHATLATHRPAVFLEVLHIGDPDAIERQRTELDYVDVRLLPEALTVGERVQHDPDAWNHLLIPAERLDELLAVLACAGLVPAR